MGLGTVNNSTGIYLSIAGGFIWNRKADKSDPNFAKQTFTRVDKTEGVRQGAQYADLDGKIVAVAFRTHDEYGESINITIDSEGERYIVSISTNNRYSQDMMKFLLKGDLKKPIFMKPYDFVGKDKKRAMGISFRQDGEKITLRTDDAPSKESDWFKSATKKEIRRFFEDLNDWYVAEIEEKVCPQFGDLPTLEGKPKVEEEEEEEQEEAQEEAQETQEEAQEETPEVESNDEKPEATALQMKKALRAFIKENYEGKTLPKLSKSDLLIWYNLSLEEEELPFEIEDADAAEVPKNDLDGQLDLLIKKK